MMIRNGRDMEDAMHALDQAGITDWADINHLLDRLVTQKGRRVATGEGNLREPFAEGVAFITFDYGIDGVSIEISKYASCLEKVLSRDARSPPIHLIGGDFTDKADAVIAPNWHRFTLPNSNGWDKWDGGRWFSRLFYEDMPQNSQASSEMAADSSIIMALDYGDPLQFERFLQTTKTCEELHTAVNQHGHRHFRSIGLSATAVQEDGLDANYHGRAMRPAAMIAWYSGIPRAVNLVHDWAKAWSEDTLRAGKGKPAGVMPALVRFADDNLDATVPHVEALRPALVAIADDGYSLALQDAHIGVSVVVDLHLSSCFFNLLTGCPH